MVSHFFYYVHTFCIFKLKLVSTSNSLRYLRLVNTTSAAIKVGCADILNSRYLKEREVADHIVASTSLLERDRLVSRGVARLHIRLRTARTAIGLVIEQKERYYL
eukprot:scaffold6789_cov206-Skeletonema_marinoi.AAC.20